MKMKDPNGSIHKQTSLLAIAITISLHSSIIKQHKTLLFHSKLLWTCQMYHTSGGDLLTLMQISTTEHAEIKLIFVKKCASARCQTKPYDDHELYRNGTQKHHYHQPAFLQEFTFVQRLIIWPFYQEQDLTFSVDCEPS